MGLDINAAIPLGQVLNARGQEVSFKTPAGYWYKNTYDALGRKQTLETCFGFRRAYTWDDDSNYTTTESQNVR